MCNKIFITIKRARFIINGIIMGGGEKVIGHDKIY